METYFARPVLRMILRQPLVAAGRDGQFDVICKVTGGGLSGQAGALRHGISKATLYHWKKQYGDLQVSDAKKLKALEDENRRLKRLVADQALNLQILKDVLGKER